MIGATVVASFFYFVFKNCNQKNVYCGGIVSQFFPGYIDELRISNIARWTDNFNPEPVVNGSALLRVTMLDSSEREYRLTNTEVDGFVNWYNHHVSTDTTSYAINDSVDRSKEYLSFDKIISFKVIPTVE